MHNSEVTHTAKKKVTFASTIEEIDPIELPLQYRERQTIFVPNYNRVKIGLRTKENARDNNGYSLEAKLFIFLLVLGACLVAMEYVDDIKTMKQRNGL